MAGRVELSEEQHRALARLRAPSERLGLYLAGGTALTIHLGHRTSRDLDLFSRAAFGATSEMDRAPKVLAALLESSRL